MKTRLVVFALVLCVSSGVLGCTATTTMVVAPTPSGAAELRRLGLSDEGTPTALIKVLPGATRAEEPIQAKAVVLEPFVDEPGGLRGLMPSGWRQFGPGAYARDEVTRIVQQAGPGTTVYEFIASWVPELGTESMPESHGHCETAALSWYLYTIQVRVESGPTTVVDLALAETKAAAYVILFQSTAEEHATLYETVFLPVMDALTPI